MLNSVYQLGIVFSRRCEFCYNNTCLSLTKRFSHSCHVIFISMLKDYAENIQLQTRSQNLKLNNHVMLDLYEGRMNNLVLTSL